MKTRSAILVGVGGQGAILTAKVFVNGLMKAGYDVKMSEVHGMSQRGGSVSTQVHWGDKVYSPVIGEGAADLMVAFEKMEAVRYARFLKPDGVAVINDYAMPSSTVAAGLEVYPEGCLEAMEAAFRCFTLDAEQIALELGNVKCANIVLFGAMISDYSQRNSCLVRIGHPPFCLATCFTTKKLGLILVFFGLVRRCLFLLPP